jgi:quinolinate synthase
MVVKGKEAEEAVSRFGFLPLAVDPSLDLVAEINRLRREKRAVILAHYYQDSEIQDLADYVGDSLGLSQFAAKTDAKLIAFAGVHFMAETGKILNPHKKVVLPDLNAGCSLSDSAPAAVFKAWRDQYPDHQVVTYINCSAELKALSDVIVTSSNAVKIVQSFAKSQKLIFAPDKHLGAYVAKLSGRVIGEDILLWNGACMVHEIFSAGKLDGVQIAHPNAEIIAHPECDALVLERAKFIGSTTALLNYTSTSKRQSFIVATEPGILHQMRKANPTKLFIPAPSNQACACNNCPHMRLNTLEKLYLALEYELPEVNIPEPTLSRARAPIDRMLELSR